MDFLKSNRRFSFKLDGVAVEAIPCSTELTENGKEICTVYRFDGGLTLTNKAKKSRNMTLTSGSIILKILPPSPPESSPIFGMPILRCPLRTRKQRNGRQNSPIPKRIRSLLLPTARIGCTWNFIVTPKNLSKTIE